MSIEPNAVTAPDTADRSCVVVPSPLGALEIVARHGAVVALNWTCARPADAAPADPLLAEAAAQLRGYFHDGRREFDLPFRPAGNMFEQAVWQAMLRIPHGATMTYGEIAVRTGRPAQAVGQACGRNPMPILIPCHRVVGAGGRLTGYSGKGGVETKQWLLRHEGALLI